MSTFVICAHSLVLSQSPYRLISRFFLNLRAICYYDLSTGTSHTAVSTMPSPIRTHPFWRRPRRLTTTFSYEFGTEASTDGDVDTEIERGIPQVESDELDGGMVSRTRQDSDRDAIRLDVVTMDKK